MLIEPLVGYKSTWRILSLLMETPRRLVSRRELFKFTRLGNAPLSHGLEKLVRAEILVWEKRGNKDFYYINESSEYASLLKQIWEKERADIRNLPYPIKIVLSEFLRYLNDACSGVENVVLFGSQAKGTASVHSDIDVAVVFEKDLSQEILVIKAIQKIKRQFKVKLQAHCFTADSFSVKNGLTKEINRDGINLTT